MTGIPPKAIECRNSLQRLYLARNLLKSIDLQKTLNDFPLLEMLDLSQNQIASLGEPK